LKLNELKKGEKAIVLKVNANGELKQRLASFGLIKGASVEIIDCSIGKSTIEIMVDGTLLALRASEAEQIDIRL